VIRRLARELLDDFAPRLAIILVVLMLAFIAWDVWWDVSAP
jgi:hypothetical protein